MILISELGRRVNSNKALRMHLNEILGEFVEAKKSKYSDEEFERSGKGHYYNSLNYSRVKIGQKIFERKILFN